MSSQPVPSEFAHLVDLASDLTGTFVLWATDDYFAPKENLLKPGAPEWREGEYTDRGKWMDGWESQRRREPGHDSCIIRLGTPGRIHGLLVDTTWFRGNAPQEIGLDGIVASDTATASELIDHPGWRPLVPRTAVLPHHPNIVQLAAPSERVTHVRLHQFPDGGVSRLRVFGEVAPEPRTFWQPAAIDLCAIENGGTVAAVSDQFFGPPSNLLLPGRGVNMGDGWETKRRRTPGSDWCVLRLARRGVVQRLELDTHFFKGNAPQATVVEYLDARTEPSEAVLRGAEGWRPLVEKTSLVQHRRHIIEPSRPLAVTHLRVHIFPHGGVNRLRIYGHALDTPGEAVAVAALNALPVEAAREVLLSFCGAKGFAERLLVARPFASVRALFQAAEDAFWASDDTDKLAAFAAHPRIGQSKAAPSQTHQSASWSAGEQSGVQGAAQSVTERLENLNDAYFDKFGFIFICFATGRTARQMLELLEERLENDRATEIENAAREQARITRLRIGKWLLAQGA